MAETLGMSPRLRERLRDYALQRSAMTVEVRKDDLLSLLDAIDHLEGQRT